MGRRGAFFHGLSCQCARMWHRDHEGLHSSLLTAAPMQLSLHSAVVIHYRFNRPFPGFSGLPVRGLAEESIFTKLLLLCGTAIMSSASWSFPPCPWWDAELKEVPGGWCVSIWWRPWIFQVSSILIIYLASKAMNFLRSRKANRTSRNCFLMSLSQQFLKGRKISSATVDLTFFFLENTIRRTILKCAHCKRKNPTVLLTVEKIVELMTTEPGHL